MVWKKEMTELRKIYISEREFGYLVNEMAKELKVHRASVYRWLNGTHEPRRKRKAIVRALIAKYKQDLTKA